eukprot:TRINITY_DN2123_c0_g1_i1.p1 TRINITY_DN2123_c0_g1~~TRINITY_DN2123_c0_g1_i1.p1  ORF type:complete len:286 (-),score=79.85 TRINITY_DN2123_c0_g1_i1:29-829(-)
MTLLGLGVGVGLMSATVSSQQEQDGVVHASDALHPVEYPWNHEGFFNSFDTASIRRGHQVYSEICSSCHGVERIAWRNLVGVAYTEEEAKELAAEMEVEDGPNAEGDMYTRPGKLSDYIKSPYRNEEEARAQNNNAYPHDLSLITKSRPGGANYLFALLTGYKDAPAGVVVPEGLHYNPYFPGGAIAMPQQIMDDCVEFEDGTPASASQIAKDVTVFLAWAAEPEADERKKIGLKTITLATFATAASWYLKKHVWAGILSRRVTFK